MRPFPRHMSKKVYIEPGHLKLVRETVFSSDLDFTSDPKGHFSFNIFTISITSPVARNQPNFRESLTKCTINFPKKNEEEKNNLK